MRRAFNGLIGLMLLFGVGLADRQAAAASSPKGGEAAAPATTPSDKLRLLLDLVEDPDVRTYLEQRRPGAAAPTAPDPSNTMAGGLGDGLQRLRNRIRALAEAVPRLPGQVFNAGGMLSDMLGRGDAISLALFLPVFVALGLGGEWLFRTSTRGVQQWLIALPLQSARERVLAVFTRLAYSLGMITSYALGSIGAFLPFEWSRGFKAVLLALLLASLVGRLAYVVGRFLLAPGAARFRVVPMGTGQARFLFHRLVLVGLLLGIGSQLIALLAAFGFDLISQDLCADALGIIILGMALEAVWRYPHETVDLADDGVLPAGPLPDQGTALDSPAAAQALTPADIAVVRPEPTAWTPEWHRLRRRGAKITLSIVLVLLWCFWVADAATPFWVLGFATGLPAAVVLTQRSIRHVLRPGGRDTAFKASRLDVVFLERGIRTLLIAGGAVLLAHLIGLDVASLTMQDTVGTRISRAVLGVVVVVLVADFLWHVIAALIDRKLAKTLGGGDATDGTGHSARLQTLLPILKNLSLAVLAVVTAMMLLAAIGVEIGPLIASAGVVGVAIGFGAQTLVKDIISGIFYLIDDAFRIGEYIQSGTYKGTVESFSLRSVKLRHQRGALYTVPFGILGAVQNQSRDWVVDKISINVPYETDLDRVRKIVKRIGETLAEDAELGPDILKPLKLQGVAQFGDYAVQLQTKMMTKPGDVQFAARRRALMMIKSEFQANGIGFALPMVHVSGEGSEAAAAQRALSMVKGTQANAAE